MFDLINGPFKGVGTPGRTLGHTIDHNNLAAVALTHPAGRTSPIRKFVDSLVKLMDQRSFEVGTFAHALDSSGGAACIEFMGVIDAFLDMAIIRYDNDAYRSYAERDEVGVVAHRIRDALEMYQQTIE